MNNYTAILKNSSVTFPATSLNRARVEALRLASVYKSVLVKVFVK